MQNLIARPRGRGKGRENGLSLPPAERLPESLMGRLRDTLEQQGLVLVDAVEHAQVAESGGESDSQRCANSRCR
jgi:hypothetical protein